MRDIWRMKEWERIDWYIFAAFVCIEAVIVIHIVQLVVEAVA